MGQDGCDKTDSFDEELNLSERATFAGEEEDFKQSALLEEEKITG